MMSVTGPGMVPSVVAHLHTAAPESDTQSLLACSMRSNSGWNQPHQRTTRVPEATSISCAHQVLIAIRPTHLTEFETLSTSKVAQRSKGTRREARDHGAKTLGICILHNTATGTGVGKLLHRTLLVSLEMRS